MGLKQSKTKTDEPITVKKESMVDSHVTANQEKIFGEQTNTDAQQNERNGEERIKKGHSQRLLLQTEKQSINKSTNFVKNRQLQRCQTSTHFPKVIQSYPQNNLQIIIDQESQESMNQVSSPLNNINLTQQDQATEFKFAGSQDGGNNSNLSILNIRHQNSGEWRNIMMKLNELAMRNPQKVFAQLNNIVLTDSEDCYNQNQEQSQGQRSTQGRLFNKKSSVRRKRSSQMNVQENNSSLCIPNNQVGSPTRICNANAGKQGSPYSVSLKASVFNKNLSSYRYSDQISLGNSYSDFNNRQGLNEVSKSGTPQEGVQRSEIINSSSNQSNQLMTPKVDKESSLYLQQNYSSPENQDHTKLGQLDSTQIKKLKSLQYMHAMNLQQQELRRVDSKEGDSEVSPSFTFFGNSSQKESQQAPQRIESNDSCFIIKPLPISQDTKDEIINVDRTQSVVQQIRHKQTRTSGNSNQVQSSASNRELLNASFQDPVSPAFGKKQTFQGERGSVQKKSSQNQSNDYSFLTYCQAQLSPQTAVKDKSDIDSASNINKNPRGVQTGKNRMSIHELVPIQNLLVPLQSKKTQKQSTLGPIIQEPNYSGENSSLVTSFQEEEDEEESEPLRTSTKVLSRNGTENLQNQDISKPSPGFETLKKEEETNPNRNINEESKGPQNVAEESKNQLAYSRQNTRQNLSAAIGYHNQIQHIPIRVQQAQKEFLTNLIGQVNEEQRDEDDVSNRTQGQQQSIANNSASDKLNRILLSQTNEQSIISGFRSEEAPSIQQKSNVKNLLFRQQTMCQKRQPMLHQTSGSNQRAFNQAKNQSFYRQRTLNKNSTRRRQLQILQSMMSHEPATLAHSQKVYSKGANNGNTTVSGNTSPMSMTIQQTQPLMACQTPQHRPQNQNFGRLGPNSNRGQRQKQFHSYRILYENRQQQQRPSEKQESSILNQQSNYFEQNKTKQKNLVECRKVAESMFANLFSPYKEAKSKRNQKKLKGALKKESTGNSSNLELSQHRSSSKQVQFKNQSSFSVDQVELQKQINGQQPSDDNLVIKLLEIQDQDKKKLVIENSQPQLIQKQNSTEPSPPENSSASSYLQYQIQMDEMLQHGRRAATQQQQFLGCQTIKEVSVEDYEQSSIGNLTESNQKWQHRLNNQLIKLQAEGLEQTVKKESGALEKQKTQSNISQNLELLGLQNSRSTFDKSKTQKKNQIQDPYWEIEEQKEISSKEKTQSGTPQKGSLLGSFTNKNVAKELENFEDAFKNVQPLFKKQLSISQNQEKSHFVLNRTISAKKQMPNESKIKESKSPKPKQSDEFLQLNFPDLIVSNLRAPKETANFGSSFKSHSSFQTQSSCVRSKNRQKETVLPNISHYSQQQRKGIGYLKALRRKIKMEKHGKTQSKNKIEVNFLGESSPTSTPKLRSGSFQNSLTNSSLRVFKLDAIEEEKLSHRSKNLALDGDSATDNQVDRVSLVSMNKIPFSMANSNTQKGQKHQNSNNTRSLLSSSRLSNSSVSMSERDTNLIVINNLGESNRSMTIQREITQSKSFKRSDTSQSNKDRNKKKSSSSKIFDIPVNQKSPEFRTPTNKLKSSVDQSKVMKINPVSVINEESTQKSDYASSLRKLSRQFDSDEQLSKPESQLNCELNNLKAAVIRNQQFRGREYNSSGSIRDRESSKKRNSTREFNSEILGLKESNSTLQRSLKLQQNPMNQKSVLRKMKGMLKKSKDKTQMLSMLQMLKRQMLVQQLKEKDIIDDNMASNMLLQNEDKLNAVLYRKETGDGCDQSTTKQFRNEVGKQLKSNFSSTPSQSQQRNTQTLSKLHLGFADHISNNFDIDFTPSQCMKYDDASYFTGDDYMTCEMASSFFQNPEDFTYERVHDDCSPITQSQFSDYRIMQFPARPIFMKKKSSTIIVQDVSKQNSNNENGRRNKSPSEYQIENEQQTSEARRTEVTKNPLRTSVNARICQSNKNLMAQAKDNIGIISKKKSDQNNLSQIPSDRKESCNEFSLTSNIKDQKSASDISSNFKSEMKSRRVIYPEEEQKSQNRIEESNSSVSKNIHQLGKNVRNFLRSQSPSNSKSSSQITPSQDHHSYEIPQSIRSSSNNEPVDLHIDLKNYVKPENVAKFQKILQQHNKGVMRKRSSTHKVKQVQPPKLEVNKTSASEVKQQIVSKPTFYPNKFTDQICVTEQNLDEKKQSQGCEEIKPPSNISIENKSSSCFRMSPQKIQSSLEGFYSPQKVVDNRHDEQKAKTPNYSHKRRTVMHQSSQNIFVPVSLRDSGEIKNNVRRMDSITTKSAISRQIRGKERINQYQMTKKLGAGAFSQVMLCIDINTNKMFAMKIMQKQKLRRKTITNLGASAYDNVQQEIAIMKKLTHPYILKLHEVIDDPTDYRLYLIFDYIKHGTLTTKVLQSFGKETQQRLRSTILRKKVGALTHEQELPKEGLPEAQIRKYFVQLTLALEYCHNQINIIHRDIKPDNILIDENDDIKLTDFGVSQLLPQDQNDKMSSNAGSALFFSPQACMGKQYRGRKNDIWACGITLYFMATGEYPFDAQDQPSLMKMIQNTEPRYPSKLPLNLKDLIKKLLKKPEEERIGFEEIKKHPWVTNDSTEPVQNLKLDFQAPNKQEIKRAITKKVKKTKYIISKKKNQEDEEEEDDPFNLQDSSRK